MTLKTVCSHEGGGCVLKKFCCDLLRVKLAALQFSNSLYDFFFPYFAYPSLNKLYLMQKLSLVYLFHMTSLIIEQ